MSWIPVAIACGAVLGALGRHYLTLFWATKRGGIFPYGTLFVNLTGAFAIGTLSALAATHTLPMATQRLVLVGFLGSYTTFSSYILDTTKLFRSHRRLIGLCYWIGSPVLGLICVQLGLWLGNCLP